MSQTLNQAHKASLLIVASIAFIMLLTRGSHVMTHVSLPDASLALFLIGGMLLRKLAWFFLLTLLATVIDFTAATVNSYFAFCLTAGYWGMLPTYAVMWLAGLWLSKQDSPLSLVQFALTGIIATFLAFVISTQSYYLFSGRFPNAGLLETLQHGWNYLPSYMGFTLMYLSVFWAAAKALPKLGLLVVTSKVA